MSQHKPFDLAIPVGAGDHVLGPAHAHVTIVEYGDFECPICKQAAPALKVLRDRFAGQIRFAFRHFPLEEVHPHALAAAEAAEAAASQGRFWDMHDLLFDNQAHLKPKHLHGYAERLELDLARFTAEMDEHVYVQRIREHIESGRRSHVRGTPGLFLNGMIQDASPGLRGLVAATEKILHAR
jgi:protein-disulfide isomerase